MGIEEGLGKDIGYLEFTVTQVDGDRVSTNCFPKEFKVGEYAPFDYRVGQLYSRRIWENGEFLTFEGTGETYLVRTGGVPIKVEGDLDDFIDRIEKEGERNRFNRLLSEGKIKAFVRTHSYDPVTGSLLEVALVDGSDTTQTHAPFMLRPFEAYSILLNLREGTAQIVTATCEYGFFDENLAHFKAAKPLTLPRAILEIANPKDLLSHHDPKPLPDEAMAYIRENCCRPS